MENLETQDQEQFQEPKASAGSTALTYGLIGGIALCILSTVSFMLNLEQNAGWVSTVLSIAIFVAAIFYATKIHRDQKLGGTISFGKGFTVGFLTALIMAVIGSIFMYIYVQFIDTSVIAEAERQMEQEMAKQDMTREEMDQAMGFAKIFVSPGAMAIMGLLMNTIIGLVVALIGGAIYQRNN